MNKFLMRLQLWVAALTLSSAAVAGPLYTTNFGAELPGYYQNDDSSFSLTLPFSVQLGTDAATNAIRVDNNGSVYNGNSSLYVWFNDLDSRGGGTAGIHYRAEGTRAIISWVDMGLYSYNYRNRFTFQLVLDGLTQQAGVFFADGFYAGTTGTTGAYFSSGTLRSYFNDAGGPTYYFDLATGRQIAGFSNTVPEPSSIALAMLAMGALVWARKRKA